MAGPLDLQVRGADKLAKVAKVLREAGDKELKKELTRGLRAAAQPLVVDAKKEFVDRLPQHGGLAKLAGRSRFTVKVRTSGRMAGVKIAANGPKERGGGRLNIRALNRGTFRHPVYPRGPRDQWTWVEQKIKPGAFDDTLARHKPRIQGELIKAIDEVARKVGKA